MGWLSDEEGHEGYVLAVAPDGRTSGSSNAAGILLWRPDVDQRVAAAWAEGRPPTTEEMYELVPYAEVVGWEAGCSCGWTGRRWTRGETTPGEYGGHDADDAYLPDGRTVEDHGLDLWKAHMEPVGRLSAVERAADALAQAREALDQAVLEARGQEPAASWTEIGRAAGMTRQSAHEKWG